MIFKMNAPPVKLGKDTYTVHDESCDPEPFRKRIANLLKTRPHEIFEPEVALLIEDHYKEMTKWYKKLKRFILNVIIVMKVN